MLPVNELAVISPEWGTTGSLPGYLPTEAATGSRPKKINYIEANPYYFVNSGYYEGKSNIDKNTMKSIRNIKKGEEILSNYQRYEKFDKNII